MTISKAIVATHRFGLGPRPGDLDFVKSDPQAWLLNQIGQKSSIAFLASAEVLNRQAQNRQARQNQDEELSQRLTRQLALAHISDAATRIRHSITTDTPFAERLVHFWSNHFAISADKAAVSGIGGSFEGEAIRPNIFARFEDLLMASTKHPGMLLYLDNAQSTGPNSRGGSRSGRGLNENLAREILELHTLGVNGGYSQEDVTNFAKVITGWSVATGPAAERFGEIEGSFAYLELAHEPGDHRVLGRNYRQSGIAQGEAVLKDLAAHPKTAEHIATKLARHFISDDPPPSAVAAISKSFLDSGGDLSTVYKTLLHLDEVWDEERLKYRAPNEWMVSILRAVAYIDNQSTGIRDNQLITSLATLGQPLWRPGSPAGWPDTADRWTSPDSLGKRIEWADTLAQKIGTNLPATEMLNTLYGTEVNPELVMAVSRAETNAQALVLVAMAPDALRR
jgi:uncharacterized protein (DUF1800 family)